MKLQPDITLRAADKLLILYLLIRCEYLKNPGIAGSLLADCKKQRIFLSLLLGLKPGAIHNPIKCINKKTLLSDMMERTQKLTQSQINEYMRRLITLRKVFSYDIYPKCIVLIDNRLEQLAFMVPGETK